MKTFEECKSNPVYRVIKECTLNSINDYVQWGYEPGGFVKAVLANDLMAAVGRADSENLLTLHAICTYVYNEIPGNLQGSWEAVKEHLTAVHERFSRD